MRKLFLVTAALVALALPSGAAGFDTGIRGRVFDTSCYGPCSTHQEPSLYTGDGLTVRVKTWPDREVVAVLHPRDGRFRVAEPPGSYVVRASVRDECWRGERKRVQVVAGAVAHIRLHVQNACIV
jgi:hypothetical protein